MTYYTILKYIKMIILYGLHNIQIYNRKGAGCIIIEQLKLQSNTFFFIIGFYINLFFIYLNNFHLKFKKKKVSTTYIILKM